MTPKTLVPVVLLLIPAALPAQSPASILGEWHGTSICVKASWNAGCHDERIVYAATPSRETPGGVTLRASKIVGDSLDWMGDLELAYDSLAGRWAGDFQNSRVHIRWSYRVEGDSLTGTLVLIPTGQLARNVNAARVPPNAP